MARGHGWWGEFTRGIERLLPRDFHGSFAGGLVKIDAHHQKHGPAGGGKGHHPVQRNGVPDEPVVTGNSTAQVAAAVTAGAAVVGTAAAVTYYAVMARR